MSVRSSEYSQRMWTMLETVLAKEIYVQLENETVSLDEIIKERDSVKMI